MSDNTEGSVVREMFLSMRKFPNIIITGTPGVGKTTTATQILTLVGDENESSPIPLKHLNVNDVAKRDSLYESYDAELDTHVVDEDKVLDEIEKMISDGDDQETGWLIDWHVCDIFPERWIDLVIVLRCEDTAVFYERLETRGYKDKKRDENIDSEILRVVAEEAKEGYPSVDVVELKSVDFEDIESNSERVIEWVKAWLKRRREDDGDAGENVNGEKAENGDG